MESLDRARLDVQRKIEEARRSQAIQNALEEAERLAKNGLHERATELLRGSEYKSEPRVAALLRSTEEDLARRRHTDAVDAIRRQAEALIGEERYDDAIRAIQTNFPNEPELRKQLAKAREGKADLARRQHAEAVDAIRKQAEAAIADERYDEAIRAIETSFPNEPELRKQLAKAREGKADLARRRHAEAVDAIRKQAEAFIEAERYDDAIRAIQASFPNEPELRDPLAKAREGKIESVLREARQLVQAGSADRAIELLRRSEHTNEPRAAALLRSIELDAVRKQAEALIADSRYDDALRAIEGQFAKEPALETLQARARTGRNNQRRDQLLEDAKALERKAAYADALHVVERALRDFGGSPDGIALQKRLTTQIEAQRQREELGRDRAELLAIEQQIPKTRKGKLTLLRTRAGGIASAHHSDPEIAAIVLRIQEHVDARLAEPSKPLPWKWIAGGGAVVALLAAAVMLVPRGNVKVAEPPPVVKVQPTVSVQIHTDPAGASVKLGKEMCVTPQCRFDLAPGQYSVEARLDGYQPVQRTVDIDPAKPLNTINLSLEPIRVEVAPTAATGTLEVRTNVPDTLVYIDNRGRGRTDATGVYRLSLEAKVHSVRADKPGYQPSGEQRIAVPKDATGTVNFKLSPLDAKFQILNAPAGVELRMGDAVLGKSSGGPVFSFTVPPGKHRFQVSLNSASSQFVQSFDPGQQVSLDWRGIAPAAPPPPVVKPQPSEDTLAAQAWDRVHDSSDAAQLKAFADKYPSSPHAEEAKQKIQSMEKNAREQAAVREQAEQKARDEAARAKALRDQAEQAEKEKLLAVQSAQSAVQTVLESFNAAFRRRKPGELKGIWPSVRSEYLDSARSGRSVSLQASGAPTVEGDKATIACQLMSDGRPTPRPRHSREAKRILAYS